MNTWTFRPADPEGDFEQLAIWFTILENATSTESNLRRYYEREKERIMVNVAEQAAGGILGFYWIEHDKIVPDRETFSLYVESGHRFKGLGSRLYEDMVHRIDSSHVNTLRVNVRDDCPEGLEFAKHRGFKERSHLMAMSLDLRTFDDNPYEQVITRLKREGFQFTSMEELGNTEEAQRKLYEINEMTAREIPGSSGESSWASFEDFQQRVCQTDWYKPAGQMVVIDTATGDWAAMSAITCFAENDYAYNLHTGVDKRYRGRKLGQAVKVHALRFARDVLKVNSVHTHHNSMNSPILSIDRKFGYMPIPGFYSMEKCLKEAA